MLLYGTAINVAAAIVALVLFARDAPAAIGAAVFIAPLPYNLFLLVTTWRAAAGVREPWSTAARLAALLWLVAVTVI